MKTDRIIIRFIVAVNCLLLFVVLFRDFLKVPSWLMVFGRMHPLLLHFPIVLTILYALSVLLIPASQKSQAPYRVILYGLLLAAALTCGTTALMGFFLSTGDGYDSDALTVHQWSGVGISFLLYGLIFFHSRLVARPVLPRILAGIMIVLMVVAGHYGSVITHGENFVLEPVNPDEPVVVASLQEAVIYNDLVRPVLEAKCVSCHNSGKAKGELRLDTREHLLRGGKNGQLWDTAKADLGLMISRIHLPESHKKHMPPAGKPQLTDEESAILYRWIYSGADFDKRVMELPAEDSLMLLAKSRLPSSVEERYDFAAADEAVISRLNNQNRVILPVALGSPALQVSFFNKEGYTDKSLKELTELAGQIVDLNLAFMPLKDEAISIIAQFTNLRKLNVSFTDLTGIAIGELKKLQHLKSISLSGTMVDRAGAEKLETFPALHTAYLWNTPAAGVDRIRRNNKILFQTGFPEEGVVLQLTPPVFRSSSMVIDSFISVKLAHPIGGTDIRYTLDGSEPDSIRSSLFRDSLILTSNATLKARAFKRGWEGSNRMQTYFFKRRFLPDTVMVQTRPYDATKTSLAGKLFDGEKSDVNFASQRWFFVKKGEFSVTMRFAQPVTCSNVTLSLLEHLSDGIFPPERIEVFVGNDLTRMRKVQTVRPAQASEMEFRKILGIECNFDPVKTKYIRLDVYPLPVIPHWHQLKGSPTALYMDEIFIN